MPSSLRTAFNGCDSDQIFSAQRTFASSNFSLLFQLCFCEVDYNGFLSAFRGILIDHTALYRSAKATEACNTRSLPLSWWLALHLLNISVDRNMYDDAGQRLCRGHRRAVVSVVQSEVRLL